MVQSQERKKPNHGVANPKDKLCPALTKCRKQILCDYDANLPSTSESCNTASNFEHDHCNSLKSKDYSEDTSDTRIEFVDVATNTKQSQFQRSILISDHAYSSKEDECIDTNMVDNTLNSTLNEVEIDVDNMSDFSLEDLDCVFNVKTSRRTRTKKQQWSPKKQQMARKIRNLRRQNLRLRRKLKKCNQLNAGKPSKDQLCSRTTKYVLIESLSK